MRKALSGTGSSASLRGSFSSLKARFIGALILLVGVVLAVFTLWNVHLHKEHMLRATEEKAQAITLAIDRGIQIAMREGRHQDVQRILREVGQDPDIRRVIIFDNNGKILRASLPDLQGRTLQRTRLSRYLEQPDLAVAQFYDNGEQIHSVVKRIENRPECHACHGSSARTNGILHVDISYTKTYADIGEMEQSAIWTMLLAAVILAAGGALLMVRLVDRPVAALVRAMAKVEGGDLEAHADSRRQDEFGLLAQSFNAMVNRLRAARAEIELYQQRRLERAERLASLGELAASLAHEIKNPLAGIAGAVQVMAEEMPKSHPRKPIMQEVLSQVRRLDRTVRDLLAFARPGKPDVASYDIHQILDRVLLLLAEDPEAKRIRVVRDYQPDVPPLEVDGKQLGQVFLNLILNAIQAMPGGGQATLQTRLREAGETRGNGRAAEGALVEVDVSDTGPGIPAQVLHDLFKPFVSTKHRGTGLGLSVSRRIVEDHGGWIEVESLEGQGATFRVCLPVESSMRRIEEMAR
jgi:signal transduction histidine kinase